jgi:hypothetical protein
MARIGKPSPSMIVAIIALFVALGGSGYAALSGKEKKKVRSIADKQISARAAGLSVASAQNAANAANAQNAQNAANAANATNAATAVNANALGGTAASGFPRAFSGSGGLDDEGPLFSVPQLGATILGDDFVASTFGIRVRNDRVSGSLEVGQRNDPDGGFSQTVNAGSTSTSILSENTPVTVTSDAVPGAVLVITCGPDDSGNQHCVGFLTGG